MQQAKCKISRRLGTNIFPKCEKAFARRPYIATPRKNRRSPGLSEYGKELKEKQKLKFLYNLKEKQFSNYVKNILARRSRVGDASAYLIKLLELRLDNVAYRLGFAATRQQSRQMVSHGHLMVNGRKITIPSYMVRSGDEISIRPQSKEKGLFKNMGLRLKNVQAPSWLELDKENFKAKVVADPSLAEAMPPVEISAIFEFYSR